MTDAAGVTLQRAIQETRPPVGTLAIFWLGQAGFVFRGAETTVLIDPFLVAHPQRLVPPAAPPESFVAVDAVCATHEHIDHLDLPTWPALAAASPGARFVVPAPVVEQVTAAGIAAERVTGALPDQPVQIGAATLHPVPARHGVHVADAYNFGETLSGGVCRYLGYVVELNGVRVYHAGDTIIYDGMAERVAALRPDIALLPINGRDYYREAADIVGNLSYREAAELAGAIGVPVAAPMHYEMFAANLENPGAFVNYLRGHHPSVTALVPGYATAVLVAAR